MSKMLPPVRQLISAAAVLAAAVVVLAACGDDDSGGSTPSPSPGASVSPGVPQVIDISETADVVSYTAADPADLVNVGNTLAMGDFNDDGNTDALVGAPQADGPDNDRDDAGEAYVIFGPLDEGRTLGAGSAHVTFFGAAAGDALGSTVQAGDLNDDGVDDVLIGAPGVTAGFDPRSDQGRLYVFFGSEDLGDDPERDLTENIFDATVTGAEGFSRLGHAVDVGDVNGDGTQDLVVGAPFAGRKAGTPPGGERTALGEVYVVFGSGDLSGERNIARDESDVVLSGGFAFGQFGASLGVGDIDADGTDEVVVGAYRASVGAEENTSGAVYVFKGGQGMSGRLSVEDGDQDATIIGPAASSFGFPLTIGDFNSDGTADIGAGAQLETSGLLERQGAVHVILGSSDIDGEIEAAEAAVVTITGGISGELFPSSLAAADVDGDGSDDLLTGSQLAGPDDRPSAGIVRVFTGLASAEPSIDLAEATAPVTLLGQDGDDRLGAAVAGASGGDEPSGLLLLASQAAGDGDPNAGVVYFVRVSR